MLGLILLTNISQAHDFVMNIDKYTNNVVWNETPQVIICESQTVFTKKEVEHVLESWGKKAVPVSVVEKCNYAVQYGVIKIVDARNINVAELWGSTKYDYTVNLTPAGKQYRTYLGAVVQLDMTVRNIDLLMHEMGHAFGYKHYDESYDIMNTNRFY